MIRYKIPPRNSLLSSELKSILNPHGVSKGPSTISSNINPIEEMILSIEMQILEHKN